LFGSSSLNTKWQSWRLCFFLAGLPIIWWIGDGVARLIVVGVEKSMFTYTNALYFAYAVRVSGWIDGLITCDVDACCLGAAYAGLVLCGKEGDFHATLMSPPATCHPAQSPLRNVVRAALALGWWALMMTVSPGREDPAFVQVYRVVLRLWACVTLFMTANLIKTLLAKVLATNFNRGTRYQRMKEALKKVRLALFGGGRCMRLCLRPSA